MYTYFDISLKCFCSYGETVYVRLNNGWDSVYCYMWNSDKGIDNSWPGPKMTKVEGEVYAYTTIADYNRVVFNNGNSGDGNQTDNLEFPSDGYIYDLATGTWSAYSGSKQYENFSYEVLNGTYCSIKGYSGNNKNVVIPSELDGYLVQSISQYAFQNITYLESITFPDGIESINSYAFNGCTGLTEVNLPETLTTIYGSAFSGCTSLESIEIPDSVTTIYQDAFYGCSKLSSVKLPLNWSKAEGYNGYSPFRNCASLKEITLPEGVTTVPENAFRECTGLETVVLPDSIKTIGADAFYNCIGLKNVTFSKNLETQIVK